MLSLLSHCSNLSAPQTLVFPLSVMSQPWQSSFWQDCWVTVWASYCGVSFSMLFLWQLPVALVSATGLVWFSCCSLLLSLGILVLAPECLCFPRCCWSLLLAPCPLLCPPCSWVALLCWRRWSVTLEPALRFSAERSHLERSAVSLAVNSNPVLPATVFGASLWLHLSPILHLPLFSCAFLSLPLWSVSFKSFWYIHVHRNPKRNSPQCWSSLSLDAGASHCCSFGSWPQVSVVSVSGGAPSCLLSPFCLCCFPQCPRGVLLRPPWPPLRASVQTSFLSGALLPAECVFSFHELSGPRVTSCVLPSGLLNVGFWCSYLH